MQGGRHSAAALSAFINAMYGSSVANGLNVLVTGSTGLNVNVQAGNGNIDTGQGFGRLIQIDAVQNVALTAASPSNPRNDLIVAYIDNGVTPTTSVVDNTNDILKFAAVAGTPASTPADPSNSTIQSAIGAGNPFMILARVRVNAAATSLTQGNITDLRNITVNQTLQRAYPVGSIYINATDNTNPSTLLGFGSWVDFGAGRVPVGFNASDSDFNAAQKTGGAKTHTLTSAEGPNHSHAMPAAWWSQSEGYANIPVGSTSGANRANIIGAVTGNVNGTTGQPHNNLQPYITVYMWRRTS